MNRRLVVVPLLAAALFGLAACNSTTTGSPTAGNSSGTPTAGGSGGDGGGGVSTTSLQPCDLLSADEASQLQLTKGGPIDEGGARACTWQKPVDTNGQNGYGVEIGIRDNQGLKDFNTAGYTLTDDTVGKHQGKQAALDAGGG